MGGDKSEAIFAARLSWGYFCREATITSIGPLGFQLRMIRANRVANRSRAAKRGGFQTGGFLDLDLSFLFCPFLSFLGFSRFFSDFPDLLGDGPGIFPICPFPLARPIKSTYEEQSRKGPRHNLDLSRKKVGNTRVWKPPGLASLKSPVPLSS